MKTITHKGASKNLLRDPIAALGGARSLSYLLDMSRSLRSVRLVLGPLATVFRGAHKGVGLICMLAALSGCGTVPASIVEKPTSARPVASAPAPATNGAIFQAQAYRPLFEDRRARQVGDTLVIVIKEKTNAAKEASSKASKTGSAEASISGINNLPLKALEGTAFTASSDNKYEDKSKVSSGNNFSGSIAVTVIEVLANGNLRVSGEKQIALDKGTEYIRLSGVVNPDTIRVGNTVSSTEVADARIEYRTSANFDTAEVMGWLARFFLSFAPL